MTTTLIPLIASILAAVHAPEAKEAKTPDKYVMLAAIVADRGDLPMGEKILRDGLQEFPAASGMHLVLGRILEKKGAAAEAFYEYQWEVALSGVDSEPGDEASARTVMDSLRFNGSKCALNVFVSKLRIENTTTFGWPGTR